MIKTREEYKNCVTNSGIKYLNIGGEDTGILIGTTMVYERHLWNEEVKVI